MEFTSEQKQVINTRDKNILVSAAAGAGKTAVLTARMTGRIMDEKDPVDIDRILTVTFTNAAAMEMKERIRDRLEEAYSKDPENERIRSQLNLIHNASIQTLDSFCLKVIKDNFELLSLDPSFRVGDENEISLLSEEAMEDVLSEEYEKKEPDFFLFLESCSPGREDKDIAGYVTQLSKAADTRPDSEEWLKSLAIPYEDAASGSFEDAEWLKALISITGEVLQSIKRSYDTVLKLCQKPGGPYIYEDLIRDEAGMVSDLTNAGTYRERYDLFQSLSFDRLPSKKDNSVDPKIRENVKNIRSGLKDRLLKLKAGFFLKSPEEAGKIMAYGAVPVRELVRLTLRYRQRFSEKKTEKNILDFSDVEHKALEILKKGAAGIYRDFFREVMTDEYQDSNALQEEILKLVSTENDLFSVGDVKQSIYGFRLAEPGIFMKRYRDYEEDEMSVRILLNKNFRSRKSVIDTVNGIFKHIMHKENGGIEYTGEHELNYGASYGDDGPENRSELVLIEKDDEGDLEKIEEEALYIASRIRELKDKLLITDKGSETPRKAEYRDFAILLRSVSGVDDRVRDILISAGVPAITETGTGYFKTKEIRLILNILSIIDNPRQDIPLAAVLKSPFGGFSLEELSKIRISHGEGSFYDCISDDELPEELREKCLSFLNWLNGYREILNITPLSALIGMIISDERGSVLFLQGKERENLSLLLRRAVDFERSGSRGLFRFLRYVEKIKKLNLDIGEAAGEGGADAVRILSIHKSKGLEFPVVFIANMNKKFNMNDLSGDIITHKDLGLGLSYIKRERRVKVKPLLKELISEVKKRELIGEELRIFYVAMTRAREKLIMTASVNDISRLLSKQYDIDPSYSYLDFVLSAYMEDEEDFTEHTDIFTSDVKGLMTGTAEEAVLNLGKGEELLSSEQEETDLTERIRKSLEWEYPYQEKVSVPLKVSVSELKKKDYEEALMEEEYPGPDSQGVPLFKGGSGAEKGTAFHKVLSMLKTDLKPGEEAAYLSWLSENGSITSDEKELIDIRDISAFLNTGIWKRMCEADRRNELFREQPFIVGRSASEIFPESGSEEMVQVQGIIDAFFIEDGKVNVVDYKTDHVKEAEDLIKRYRKQLYIYGQALNQLLDMEIGEKMIYSTVLKEEILL